MSESPRRSPEPTQLAAFVVELGAAMSAAGEPVYVVQDRLAAIARAYGADAATVTAFPTYLMVAMSQGQPAAIALSGSLNASPRLDQVAALSELVDAAELGDIEPSHGLARLVEIRSLSARFSLLRSLVGYAVLATGICLVLRPAPAEVAAAAILGTLVGGLRRAMRTEHVLTVMTPVLAAFAVSALTALAVRHELFDVGMRPMVAALVVFLPGAALTTAVLELAAGQMISGSSRLIAGGVQLALLAFGILAGIQAVGIPRTRLLFDTEIVLGAWSQWLGVLVFAVGVFFAEAAPPRSLPGLTVVLVVAWTGQVVGNAMFGGYLAALLGATLMTVTAFALGRLPGSLPGHAAFLPGFWLLVPGALGLIGLTRFAGGAGIQELMVTTGSIFAVALGVLCGTQLLEWGQATGRAIDKVTAT